MAPPSVSPHLIFRDQALHRDLALLLLIIVACAFPFLRQPFHMDDNFYMDMARNAQIKPLYPNDTPYIFEGRQLPDMGSHSHPPLQTYFLAILQKNFGEGAGKERLYHSAALFFPILALASFYFLSARFVERPIWPALLLACCPLFMVMQHNLMTDVPALAYWLAAIAAFVWAVDANRKWLFLVSSIFQFAAMFTSYQSIALTPLLAFYLLRRKGAREGWISLAVPLIAMAAWFGMNYHHYHRLILGDTLGYVRSRHPVALQAIRDRVIATLEYQGWLIIFPFFLLYTLARGLRGRILALALLASLYVAQALVSDYRLTDKAIFVVGLIAGFFVVRYMIAFCLNAFLSGDEEVNRDQVEEQFIALWYSGVLVSCLFFLTEGSARYQLPLVPPLLIVFFRYLESREIAEYRQKTRPLLNSAMLASGSLVVSLCWGLLLSHADLEFARIYPRAAREFSHISSGMTSYFEGEWGFRYYFGQEGVAQLPADDSRVGGGSWLARPKLALPYNTPLPLSSMSMPVQSLTYDPPTPIRLLDWRTPAGFWSTGWGLIPFSLSRQPLEEVEIRQVNFLVERLPWAKVKRSPEITPWPGYLEVQERSPLALLVKPGTIISYDWSAQENVNLDLKCGIGPDAYREGTDCPFFLSIRQYGDRGRILSEFSATLNPGIRKEDRRWHEVRMDLLSRQQGGESLELACECKGGDGPGTVAFAEAVLRPALRR